MILDNIKKFKNGGNEFSKIVSKNKTIWQGRDFGIGPQTLIGGNMEAGFFGEVPSSDFITGDELAAMVGLTKGASQNSNEPWLKFAYKGNVQYVAKKTFRYYVTWKSIDEANAVYGDRILSIKNRKYKIRLMRGIGEDFDQDPKTSFNSNDTKIYYNSEWNKLMLPIHENAPSSFKRKENVNMPTEDWGVDYKNDDLSINVLNGCETLCQEKLLSYNRCLRGNYSITGAGFVDLEFDGTGGNRMGWRPVLELVE